MIRYHHRLHLMRSAPTVEGLAEATSTVLFNVPFGMSAPNVMYRDDTYFLSFERVVGGVWQTYILSSASPTGPFTLLPGNPVLGNGEACFTQLVIGTTLHAYNCKFTDSTWTLEHRSADLAAGRPRVPYLDSTKWTPGGNGTWSVTTTQPNGATGVVAQIVGDPNRTGEQILRSSYTGTDYVLEGYGQLAAGRVWGLGTRVTDQDNLYTANLYEDLDKNNLYLIAGEQLGDNGESHAGRPGIPRHLVQLDD
jgi:hypothetical protein